MLTKQTVFVIGAGASYEGGFPTGPTLAEKISELFPNRMNRLVAGEMANEAITRAVLWNIQNIKKSTATHNAHIQVDIRDMQPYRDAALLLKQGIVLANSIDDFLHLHSANAELQVLGKLAIAYAIQFAELQSNLKTEPGGIWKVTNFRNLVATYYVKMFKLISRGVSKANIDIIFNNCTIISFNYDRSLEFFLLNALMHLYDVNEARATEVLSGLKIYHPYGTVGTLPSLSRAGDNPSYYGNVLDGAALLQISTSINTYTEKVRDQQAVSELRDAISACQRLVFLGFGFHDQNLRLLSPQKIDVDKEIYATAYGIPPTNMPIIKELLAAFLPKNASWPNARDRIPVGSEYTCAGLFDSFSFPLSRS